MFTLFLVFALIFMLFYESLKIEDCNRGWQFQNIHRVKHTMVKGLRLESWAPDKAILKFYRSCWNENIIIHRLQNSP